MEKIKLTWKNVIGEFTYNGIEYTLSLIKDFENKAKYNVVVMDAGMPTEEWQPKVYIDIQSKHFGEMYELFMSYWEIVVPDNDKVEPTITPQNNLGYYFTIEEKQSLRDMLINS